MTHMHFYQLYKDIICISHLYQSSTIYIFVFIKFVHCAITQIQLQGILSLQKKIISHEAACSDPCLLLLQVSLSWKYCVSESYIMCLMELGYFMWNHGFQFAITCFFLIAEQYLIMQMHHIFFFFHQLKKDIWFVSSL